MGCGDVCSMSTYISSTAPRQQRQHRVGPVLVHLVLVRRLPPREEGVERQPALALQLGQLVRIRKGAPVGTLEFFKKYSGEIYF